MPSRIRLGRRAAVDSVVCSRGADSFSVFFFSIFFRFFFLCTHTACCTYEATSCLIYPSTSTGVRTGYHYLISLPVCLSARVTFAVFTDCESYTRPISTNPGSMEAGECGLTRGTCSLAYRLELDAVAGLLWISWCFFGWGGFFFRFFLFDFILSSKAHGLPEV